MPAGCAIACAMLRSRRLPDPATPAAQYRPRSSRTVGPWMQGGRAGCPAERNPLSDAEGLHLLRRQPGLGPAALGLDQDLGRGADINDLDDRAGQTSGTSLGQERHLLRTDGKRDRLAIRHRLDASRHLYSVREFHARTGTGAPLYHAFEEV